MSHGTFGVTEEGFVVKSQDDILVDIEADFISDMGNDFNPSQQLIAMQSATFANELARAWEAIGAGVTMWNGGNAIGYWQDMVAGLIGVFRGASSATVAPSTKFFGDEGSVVQGNTFEAVYLTSQYNLSSDLEITQVSCTDVFLTPVLTADLEYTVTINGIVYSFQSSGGSPNTATTIADGLNAEFPEELTAYAEFYNEETGEERVRIAISSLSMSAIAGSNLTLYKVASRSDLTNSDVGPITLPINSLTISVGATGLDYIRNPNTTSVGSNVQSNSELDLEREASFSVSGGGSLDGLRSALYKIEGVIDVKATQNTSENTVNGLPPKSYRMIVTGGDFDEIGQKIWDEGPLGIESYGGSGPSEGLVTVQATDDEGQPQSISFSQSVEGYVWVRLTYQAAPELSLPSDAETQIINSVFNYADSLLTTTGLDLVRDAYSAPVYLDTEGIMITLVELAITDNPGDTPSYSSAASLAVSDIQRPIYNKTRITAVL